MAFLCTFSGLLLAGGIWMTLFVELEDAKKPALVALSAWLSPMSVSGWCFYIILSGTCATRSDYYHANSS
jgi:hypothetical protein